MLFGKEVIQIWGKIIDGIIYFLGRKSVLNYKL